MPPVFDSSKTEGEGLGYFIMWSAAWLTLQILDTKAYSHSYRSYREA